MEKHQVGKRKLVTTGEDGATEYNSALPHLVEESIGSEIPVRNVLSWGCSTAALHLYSLYNVIRAGENQHWKYFLCRKQQGRLWKHRKTRCTEHPTIIQRAQDLMTPFTTSPCTESIGGLIIRHYFHTFIAALFRCYRIWVLGPDCFESKQLLKAKCDDHFIVFYIFSHARW